MSWEDPDRGNRDLGCEIVGMISDDGIIYIEEVRFYSEPKETDE